MRLTTYILVMTAAVTARAEERVRFADEHLQAAVELRLQVRNPSATDMRSLTSLAATNGIVDLTGIEHAVNLVSLDLHGNRIVDIRPLAALTRLKSLELYDNQVRDLEPLSRLTQLERLSLYQNEISDITPLSRLTNLHFLDLHRNRISNLAPVSGLKRLTNLNLHMNAITDLSPVADLTNLQIADWHNNRISDITPMSDLTGIVHLNLADNAISDISALHGFTNLRYLHLGNNKIADTALLSRLPNLVDVMLYGNPVSNPIDSAGRALTHTDTDRSAATEFTVASAKRAVARYVEELAEIDRVASERKAAAKARLDQALTQADRFNAEVQSGKRYRGMLGSYYSHQRRMPFIMLSVPDGKNVLSENSQKTFNRRYAGGTRLYKFESRGNVVIPRDGEYRLEVSRAAGIKLNGVDYAVSAVNSGELPRADVRLTQGIYEVVFDVGNNGGQMNYSHIRISEKDSGNELPIFIYESDLQKFTGDLSLGAELLETSNWIPAENEIR